MIVKNLKIKARGWLMQIDYDENKQRSNLTVWAGADDQIIVINESLDAVGVKALQALLNTYCSEMAQVPDRYADLHRP